MKAYSSSKLRSDAGSVSRLRSGEATLSATEADTLSTSGVVGSLLTSAVVRMRLLRESFLGPVCWRRDRRATRRCDTDFRSVGQVEEELKASCSESALSGSGRGEGGRQFTRGDVRWSRARADAEERRIVQRASSLFSSLLDAQSPNHAMQLTATRRAFNIYRGYNISTPSRARSR
jgi:hypothetical protein